MAKDINSILDDAIIPEMEFDPQTELKKPQIVTVDDVPEFVLPKTKAELYREAKGRLKQKTAAVSKSYKPKDRRTKEQAAAAEPLTKDHRPMLEPEWVGTADELIPFAWRNPLLADIPGQTKRYRQAVHMSKNRTDDR